MVPLFRFLLLVFLCSCTIGESDSLNSFARSYEVTGPGYRFTVDAAKYQWMDFNRADPSRCQASSEIRKINRQGNELTLEIERPKDCQGLYELVWDGLWTESAPRRMQIYLTGLYSSCEGASETEVDVIKIDLATVLSEAPKDLFTIYIREHCSFRDFNCVGNCELGS